MSLLCWTCRGLGSSSKIRSLKFLTKKYQPRIVFLSETNKNNNKCDEIACKLGFTGSFAVDSVNKSVGLCLMWAAEIKIGTLYYTNYLIHTRVTHQALSISWIITFVYGPPHWNQKRMF